MQKVEQEGIRVYIRAESYGDVYVCIVLSLRRGLKQKVAS